PAPLRTSTEALGHSLVCEKSNFRRDKSPQRRLVETQDHDIKTNPVVFVLPECPVPSKRLENLVMGTRSYYFVKNFPLPELITCKFINTFVKKGRKTALPGLGMAPWSSPPVWKNT
uniref:Uncharacterized protein n=1 Tax=Equus caballus TaxID=9796 RepID=A0A9L0TRT4_HORSE